MDGKNKVKLIILSVVTIILLVLISYGYFYTSSNQSDRDRLTGGCFSTSFTDGDSISIINALPESFDESKKGDPYSFTITNSCTLPVKYYIILNVKTGSFNPDFIDYSINNTSENKLYNALLNTNRFSIDTGYNTSYIIGSGLLKTGSKTDQIRLWIDENVNADDLDENSSFTGQIKVVGEVSSQLATDKIMNLVNGSNTNSTDIIEKEAPDNTCTNTLAYDGTTDNNLRYVGANPCNYVSFNNELWRIIGVMNNVDDGTGNLDTRIKLVRKDSLGNYSWDSSDLSINYGYGVNDWSKSDLMRELNGDYLDTKLTSNTYWFNDEKNVQTGIYDYTKTLNKENQSLLENTKWYLGGSSTSNITSSSIYGYERGTQLWGNPTGTCDDGACPRSTSWVGKVALVYPSDFGFAVGGSTRATCLTQYLGNYNNTDCGANDWLKNLSIWSRTITSCSSSNNEVYRINSGGYLTYSNAAYPRGVNPSIYLNSNVSIVSGSGTETDPYILN